MFKNVDFEDGAKSFKAIASGNACKMELCIGSMCGTPAAAVDFSGTSGFSDYQEAAFNIPKISGVKNLYIRFTGGDGYLMNMDSFVFGRGSVPLSGKLIKNLTVLDTEHSESWAIGSALGTGKLMFGDRDVTYTELPETLADVEYIITACDSKNVSGDLAEFTAGSDMTVYVALDSRVASVPAWMSGFGKTSMTVSNNKDVLFAIYSKAVKSGDKITLGTNGQSAGCVNYTVFAKTGSASVIGDVNADGEFSVADLVMMEKWLLGSKDITDWKAGDLAEDGIIDAFDLAVMRKLIVG